MVARRKACAHHTHLPLLAPRQHLQHGIRAKGGYKHSKAAQRRARRHLARCTFCKVTLHGSYTYGLLLIFMDLIIIIHNLQHTWAYLSRCFCLFTCVSIAGDALVADVVNGAVRGGLRRPVQVENSGGWQQALQAVHQLP